VPESVVLLHGFSATRRSWDRVVALLDRERYRPLPLDLPGHGEAGAVRPITFDGCIAHVLAGAPDRFSLCGYSLGGRTTVRMLVRGAMPGRAIVAGMGLDGIVHSGGRSAFFE